MMKKGYTFLGAAVTAALMAGFGAGTVSAERPELPALTYEKTASRTVKDAKENPTKQVVLGHHLTKEDLVSAPEANLPAAEKITVDLDTTVLTAIENNRDIKIAEYQYRQAEADVRKAAAGKNPSLSFNMEASRGGGFTNQNVVGVGQVKVYGVKNSFSDAVKVSWPLWTGGNLEGQIASARAQRGVKEETLYLTEAETKLSAISAYYEYLEAINLANVAKESVDNLTGHYTNVEQQYKAGIVAKLDVLTSNVSLANAKQSYITADNAKKLAEASLNNVMRLPLNTELVPASTEFPEPEFTISMEECLALADKYRWEIAKAQYGLKAAQAQLRTAKSGYLPTLAVAGSYSWNDDSFPGFENRGWGAQATLSWPLFDGGATDAKILSANNAIKEYEETLAQAREKIALEVRKDYLNVLAAKEKIRATEAAVEQAEEAFKIASIRYKSGVGINLDVLDAQLNLNNAKTNYITALYDYNVGLATLEKALGFPAVIHKNTAIPIVIEGATKTEDVKTKD